MNQLKPVIQSRLLHRESLFTVFAERMQRYIKCARNLLEHGSLDYLSARELGIEQCHLLKFVVSHYAYPGTYSKIAPGRLADLAANVLI